MLNEGFFPDQSGTEADVIRRIFPRIKYLRDLLGEARFTGSFPENELSGLDPDELDCLENLLTDGIEGDEEREGVVDPAASYRLVSIRGEFAEGLYSLGLDTRTVMSSGYGGFFQVHLSAEWDLDLLKQLRDSRKSLVTAGFLQEDQSDPDEEQGEEDDDEDTDE